MTADELAAEINEKAKSRWSSDDYCWYFTRTISLLVLHDLFYGNGKLALRKGQTVNATQLEKISRWLVEVEEANYGWPLCYFEIVES